MSHFLFFAQLVTDFFYTYVVHNNRRKCLQTVLIILLLEVLPRGLVGSFDAFRLDGGRFIWNLSERLGRETKTEGTAVREHRRQRQKPPLRGHGGQQQWDAGIFLALWSPGVTRRAARRRTMGGWRSGEEKCRSWSRERSS